MRSFIGIPRRSAIFALLYLPSHAIKPDSYSPSVSPSCSGTGIGASTDLLRLLGCSSLPFLSVTSPMNSDIVSTRVASRSDDPLSFFAKAFSYFSCLLLTHGSSLACGRSTLARVGDFPRRGEHNRGGDLRRAGERERRAENLPRGELNSRSSDILRAEDRDRGGGSRSRVNP